MSFAAIRNVHTYTSVESRYVRTQRLSAKLIYAAAIFAAAYIADQQETSACFPVGQRVHRSGRGFPKSPWTFWEEEAQRND